MMRSPCPELISEKSEGSLPREDEQARNFHKRRVTSVLALHIEKVHHSKAEAVNASQGQTGAKSCERKILPVSY
jgi:hypothetical protein